MTTENTATAGARTHTPGDWQFSSNGVIETSEVREIATVGLWIEGDSLDFEQRKANGLLIAAAPNLLEACKRLKRLCEQHCDTQAQDYTGACMAAFNAISKAEGK